MKKVILLLSTVAILGFASCTKSLDSEISDLEIVFEELEGTETKAALTEIILDKYGEYEPKSQLLTARLQYKSTKEKVSGDPEYVWDVQCGDAVEENPHPTEKSKTTLVAQSAGKGTVSVTATYKGQDVQSSSIPIRVTANELVGVKVDIRRLGPVGGLPQVPFWDNYGLTLDDPIEVCNGIFGIEDGTIIACDGELKYSLPVGIYGLYSPGYGTPYQKEIKMWKYSYADGTQHYGPEDTHYIMNTDISISFPDMSDDYFYIHPWSNDGIMAKEGWQVYCYFLGNYRDDSDLAGTHKVQVDYKGLSGEAEFEIYKIDW